MTSFVRAPSANQTHLAVMDNGTSRETLYFPFSAALNSKINNRVILFIYFFFFLFTFQSLLQVLLSESRTVGDWWVRGWVNIDLQKPAFKRRNALTNECLCWSKCYYLFLRRALQTLQGVKFSFGFNSWGYFLQEKARLHFLNQLNYSIKMMGVKTNHCQPDLVVERANYLKNKK